MRSWDAERVAAAAGARLVEPGISAGGPARAVIDSRHAGPGDLFVGLPGERVDGGRFAADVLGAGAWGVLVGEGWAGIEDPTDGGGAVLVAPDPLAALQQLATAWRRELGAQVIGVTGSTGKTSTKDLLAAMVGQQRRVVATPLNLNTEIGLPLTVPQRARRDRGARAGDGDARRRPDRRAGARSPSPTSAWSSTSGPCTWSCWGRSRRSPRPRPS